MQRLLSSQLRTRNAYSSNIPTRIVDIIPYGDDLGYSAFKYRPHNTVNNDVEESCHDYGRN
jgi:hypothetical protein